MISVIIAAIVHLYFEYHWRNDERPLVAYIVPFVVLQVETHYATMSSTFPCLGPFMKNLNTRMGTMGPEEANVYALESMNDTKGGTHRSRMNGMQSQPQTDGDVTLMSGNGDTGYSFHMQKSLRGDRGAHRSRTRGSDDSGRMIIHKTTDTTVEYEK